ncbi:MAG: alpha-L-rhamnosidase N-terminal domain-containing protein, partial [Gemmatimonadales bacterium]
LAVHWGIPRVCAAQSDLPRVFDGAPAAFWIFHPDIPGDRYGVFHFRRVLRLETVPESFVVHISGDNRYRFYVNGRQVASGPQRSDLLHWRYQTVDLAPYLHAGANVLAALVWNWGSERPVAQFSYRTGFLLQGDGEPESVANTNRDWKVLHNAGYTPIPIRSSDVGGYYAAPPGESVDGRLYPWGWRHADYDDDGWRDAATLTGWNAEITRLRGSHQTGEAWGWHLVPRSIPPMEERVVRYARVRRATGVTPDDGFLQGRNDLTIAPNTRASLLLDQSHLTNAYAVLKVSGGAGSEVRLTYAEALKDADGRKGNRNEIQGKTIAGVRDAFFPDGGDDRRFQTLWFRTYRYVRLDVETADEALRIHDFHGIFTAYPFALRARFESDLPWLSDVWEMNWRVLRLCAFETYFDTPYYEQLQYVGDTRIQALISLYLSDDDRLVRQAISHFDLSRIPEGITASRYPSELGQYIPTFSLIWIAMVHDYWMHRDDPEFVRGFLPGIRSVLSWFQQRLDETGMVGPLEWWPFVDWADEWQGGVPPYGREGRSTVITLQYVYALQRAAEMERELGLALEADRYGALADSIIAAVRRLTWDADRGLFRDTPNGHGYSQQANVMALLVDAQPAGQERALMQRILGDTTLTQATYYFGYYLLEALRRAGLGDRYVEHLAPWRGMLALGLTTTPERPEPTRSDSHAWSAHPNYGLLATVVGIRPAAPGFRRVRVAPHLGPLRHAAGSIAHPSGTIDVELVRSGDDGLTATVTLPPGLSGVFEWQGERRPLRDGRQRLEF